MNNLFRLSILIVTLTLSGCLSGGGDDDGGGFASPPPTPPPPSNAAPVISGTPPTAIKVDEAYSFTPSASDADGDKLTFSIQNQPSVTQAFKSRSATGKPPARCRALQLK
jgi:hypothetical protein